jgi:excisionase family DNA binding protein
MVDSRLSHVLEIDNMRQSQSWAPEPYVTTQEAAEFLNKPISWLYHEAEVQRIPRYKVGNQWRYKRSELDAWVRSGGPQ